MSGFLGIVNLDGAPVDRTLMSRLTDLMAFRGPDAQRIWIDGHVGFGHALLYTVDDSFRERQPCSVDGQVWISADARVDGRDELTDALQQAFGPDAPADRRTAGDIELILHAYRAWGVDCVQHLLGDFAFAIWDGRTRRLFCARDHFGVKPFFYAQLGHSVILSNTVDCLRAHPAVSDRLNDLAIADFLLFGYNQELDTTAFADIRRLPPGHYLTVQDDEVRVARYWSVPEPSHVDYANDEEVLERFRALLDLAVTDRLRTSRVGVMMSGGLDSTSVAATAHQILSRRDGPFQLRAYTVVHGDLLPRDEEGRYAGLVADSLGMAMETTRADDYGLFEPVADARMLAAHPVDNPTLAMLYDILQSAATACAVLLDGHGGDHGLAPSRSYWAYLLRTARLGQIAVKLGGYVANHRQLPPLYIRSGLRRRLGHVPKREYPPWISPGLEARLGLCARWHEHSPEALEPTSVKPDARDRYLSSPQIQRRFEQVHPGVTGFPIEVRFPWFDVRLVSFLLSVPPVPWCINKELPRRAMRGVLPEAVRRRPKAPLRGDPIGARLQQGDSTLWKATLFGAPHIEAYVDRATAQQMVQDLDAHAPRRSYLITRPISLAQWLERAAALPVLEDYTQWGVQDADANRQPAIREPAAL